MFDELSQAKRAVRNALLTIATLLLLWWIWEDRPSPIAPWQAPAKALRYRLDVFPVLQAHVEMKEMIPGSDRAYQA